jgi:hypothetical protein
VHQQGPLVLLGIAVSLAWGTTARLSVAATAHPNEATIEPPEVRLEAGSVQIGAALTAELLAGAGNICPGGASYPCVIGSGGGLALRAGYRFHFPLYLGAAYEFSKQDAHESMTLAILQQARLEGRYYLPVQGLAVPYLTGGFGAVAYGSEWSFQAIGGMGFVGLGLEFDFSRTSALALAVTYRPILLGSWHDSSGINRPTGILTMVGVEISLEQRHYVYERKGE